ncbi:hypothetical protein CRG98_009343 [Punica granatum]|uniref:Uncharacterized protein n=1 Tax=Punica granatum TaxID=22663 RepID=A0A2I0KR28_PUNGR|nr:hypothetical protein CRG98_009343 [Punica granatum]
MRVDRWKNGWERCKRYFELNGGGSFGLPLEESHGLWLGLASSRVPLDLEESRKKLGARLIERSIFMSEIVRFCPLFAPLRTALLVSVCFVLWAKWLTHRPRLEIDNQRRPRNSRTGFSQCFPSVLMYSETIVTSVCQTRVPKACREAFATIKTSLGRLL